MWGNVVLETIFTGNYTFGFLTTRSNNLLHLTHWQYWFWFWFTWYLGLYYVIFLNFFIKRNLKNTPKLATSFRSHGKWGDLLVCVIPLSWCLNILTNSNFILRLVEWQSESSNFTLRVRGKQWYWVYKIDISNFTNLQESTKQVGWTSWQTNSQKKTSTYTQVLQLQNKFENQQVFWKKASQINNNSWAYTNNVGLLKTVNSEKTLDIFRLSRFEASVIPVLGGFSKSHFPGIYNIKSIPVARILKSHPTTFVNNSDTSLFWSGNAKKSLLLTNNKFTLNNQFSKPVKQNTQNLFFIIKQKRFTYKALPCTQPIATNFKFSSNIEVGSFFKFLYNDFLKNYVFSKRLLRTSKLLVLPTNTNIAVITNSFDVIHSWFIPGLGLKLDCVPGRSTHHTLHIVNPGFYYGQCAEICGRYHHHMPIRICALNYPHFIFWWQNRGVYQYLQTNNSNIL